MRKTELILHVYCDCCPEKDEVVAVAQFTIAITAGEVARSKTRTVDVCAKHEATMKQVNLWVNKTPPGVTRGQLPCVACGRTMTQKNLMKHYVTEHGCTYITPPVDCPDCGMHIEHGSAMGRHRAATHGYPGIHYEYERQLGER